MVALCVHLIFAAVSFFFVNVPEIVWNMFGDDDHVVGYCHRILVWNLCVCLCFDVLNKETLHNACAVHNEMGEWVKCEQKKK